ncbi:DNA gyrase/topoisomerase IV subunit A family protein [Theileria parva strain Muguga]|uniref:DNA gyrase/topoisomerase IV subunit A family protein n=1 Tax=Theileria parva strain Muguga TaxID=333668 RepID=UPI001C620AB5|nr:DNA gyrase/topoisomerase IV subunit A family protein [Theileria parva strain Muguga]EAN33055.2 DNA gyrase/topoisomerase IV subunit A family protein [Theileria parva strain Muguga]
MTHLLPCFITLLYYTLNNSVDSFIVSKFYKFHDFNKILSNSGNYGDHLEPFGNTVHSVTSLKLTENDVNPLNLVADDGDLSNSSTGVEVLDGDSEKESLEYLKLNDYMCSSFLKYALSIILGRALPDSRDGLKVVHRRIIWAMHMLKLDPNGQYRKCAKVVGDVLGNYHPHSDKSVYDALCRLSQDFIMKVPLIDGHGNFGSNNDPPAAMRYTECRLTNFSKMIMLNDINFNTIDYIPNFDNTNIEPMVLPCRLPNILINGSSGIAVGLATNIPPHNPTEVINATIQFIKSHLNTTTETTAETRSDTTVDGLKDDKNVEIVNEVMGPDFPTGGVIRTTREAMRKIYESGKGTVLIQSKFVFEEKFRDVINVYNNFKDIKFKHNSRISIVINQIPYNTRINDIIENINRNIKNNNIIGVNDVKDESDRNGTRIVVELKRNISSVIEIQEIMAKLQRLTEYNYKCNFITLDQDKPIRFNLYTILKIWLDFRLKVLKRKYKHLLLKLKKNLDIINAYIIIYLNINTIINSFQNHQKGVYKVLKEEFKLNDDQMKSVMRLTLRQLNQLNIDNLKEKSGEYTKQIEFYENVLNNDTNLYNEIISDLTELKDHFKNIKRNTLIIYTDEGSNFETTVEGVEGPEGTSEDKVDPSVVESDDNIIIYNSLGRISKIKLDQKFYKSNKNKSIRISNPIHSHSTTPDTSIESSTPDSNKNNRAKKGETKIDEAAALEVGYCSNNNSNKIIIILKNGRIMHVNSSKLKLCKKGYDMFKYLGIKNDEMIEYITSIGKHLGDIIMVGYGNGIMTICNTNRLNLKLSKTKLNLKLNLKNKEIKFFFNYNLNHISQNPFLFICTKRGYCIKISLRSIMEKFDKKKNVKLIRLHKGDEVVSSCLANDQQHILILTSKGKYKLININDIKLQKIKGKGYNILRNSQKSIKKSGGDNSSNLDEAVSCTNVDKIKEKKNILLISKGGILCKKSLYLKPGLRHHKTKKLWNNIPSNDQLTYSKLL